MQIRDDEDDATPLATGSASTDGSDSEDDIPGFYIPDPDTRRGFRIWWVKRPKANGPPKRQVGFR